MRSVAWSVGDKITISDRQLNSAKAAIKFRPPGRAGEHAQARHARSRRVLIRRRSSPAPVVPPEGVVGWWESTRVCSFRRRDGDPSRRERAAPRGLMLDFSAQPQPARQRRSGATQGVTVTAVSSASGGRWHACMTRGRSLQAGGSARLPLLHTPFIPALADWRERAPPTTGPLWLGNCPDRAFQPQHPF